MNKDSPPPTMGYVWLGEVINHTMRIVIVLLKDFHMGGRLGSVSWNVQDGSKMDWREFTPFSMHVSSGDDAPGSNEDQEEGDDDDHLNGTDEMLEEGKLQASNRKIADRVACTVGATLAGVQELLDAAYPNDSSAADTLKGDVLAHLANETRNGPGADRQALEVDVLEDMVKERYSLASLNSAIFRDTDIRRSTEADVPESILTQELQHRRIQELVVMQQGPDGQTTLDVAEWGNLPALELLTLHKQRITEFGGTWGKRLSSMGLVLLSGLCAHLPLDPNGKMPKGQASDDLHKALSPLLAAEMLKGPGEWRVRHPYWGRAMLGRLQNGDSSQSLEKREENHIKALWNLIRNDVKSISHYGSKYYTGTMIRNDPVVSGIIHYEFPTEGRDGVSMLDASNYRQMHEPNMPTPDDMVRTLCALDNVRETEAGATKQFQTLVEGFCKDRILLWTELDKRMATDARLQRYKDIPNWKMAYLFSYNKMLAQQLTRRALSVRVCGAENMRSRAALEILRGLSVPNPIYEAPETYEENYGSYSIPVVHPFAVPREVGKPIHVGGVSWTRKTNPRPGKQTKPIGAAATLAKNEAVCNNYEQYVAAFTNVQKNATFLVLGNDKVIHDGLVNLNGNQEVRTHLEGLLREMKQCTKPADAERQKNLQREFDAFFKGGAKFEYAKAEEATYRQMPLTNSYRKHCVAMATKRKLEPAERMRTQVAEYKGAGEDDGVDVEDLAAMDKCIATIKESIKKQNGAKTLDELFGTPEVEDELGAVEVAASPGAIESTRWNFQLVVDIWRTYYGEEAEPPFYDDAERAERAAKAAAYAARKPGQPRPRRQ